MVETLNRRGLWHVVLAEQDLVEQAELNPEDFEQYTGHFKYMGRKVIISHKYDEHLVVSMEGETDEDLTRLMGSFSKVVQYEPFCMYNLHVDVDGKQVTLPTYEWDKIAPDLRFEVLEKKTDVSDLVRI